MYAMIRNNEAAIGETKHSVIARLIKFTISRDADTIRVYIVPGEFEKVQIQKPVAFYALEYTDSELDRELTTLGVKLLSQSGWRFYREC